MQITKKTYFLVYRLWYIAKQIVLVLQYMPKFRAYYSLLIATTFEIPRLEVSVSFLIWVNQSLWCLPLPDLWDLIPRSQGQHWRSAASLSEPSCCYHMAPGPSGCSALHFCWGGLGVWWLQQSHRLEHVETTHQNQHCFYLFLKSLIYRHWLDLQNCSKNNIWIAIFSLSLTCL